MAIFNTVEFAKDIEKELDNRRPGVSRSEMVEDFFKASVAKALECYIEQQERNTIEADFTDIVLAELISCFRSADLQDGQKSVAQYEALYKKAIQEIAANAHSEGNVTTESDSQGYVQSDGGIYIPKQYR